jgi:hypothetical protein
MLEKRWQDSVRSVLVNNAAELAEVEASPDYVAVSRAVVPTDVGKSLQGGPYSDRAWDISQILNEFLQYNFNYSRAHSG